MSSDYIRELRGLIGHQRLLLPCVAAIIRDSKGRLLLQGKGNGEPWSLPAGGIEPGESPEQALHREVQEETGLTVTQETLLAVFSGKQFRYTYPNGDQVEYTAILYGCQVTGTLSTEGDEETVELRYVSREAMVSPGSTYALALPYPMELLFDRKF
ncbi:RNA pyrophosphohydrolase [Halomonadaceae bacterium LMG 33818]|uniref:NUDIX domain-containing protein n=1 Tax=Cernens ardua TaxID=3402176 RepID=UPI003EDC7960